MWDVGRRHIVSFWSNTDSKAEFKMEGLLHWNQGECVIPCAKWVMDREPKTSPEAIKFIYQWET